jgi:pyruvate ferredoxin oxidoreductase alpha subunit
MLKLANPQSSVGQQRVGLEVSQAIAHAVKLANVDVVAAYPITPQTHIVESIAELVASGELHAAYIPVESEHSAMSACLGAAATGARAFTATASQGLELMHEVLYAVSGMRLPMVMVVANRALGAPVSIWPDHGDAMATRDTGWIQIFAANGQEAFDNVLCAFRITADERVLLPVMVHLDGFQVTHMIEPIYLPEPAEVDRFIPPHHYSMALDPDQPRSLGALTPPELYADTKKAQHEALVGSKEIIYQCWQEFGDLFGRHYAPLECYRGDDAEVILVAVGSHSETAKCAVDAARSQGISAGVIKLRLWRPFPFTEIRNAVGNTRTVIVVDRALSPGGPGGPVASEIRAALYHMTPRPKVVSFVGGLGGKVISESGFLDLLNRGIARSDDGCLPEFELV